MPAATPISRLDRFPALVHAAPLLAAAAAGVVVYHRALAYFFSQDDFLGLARASGLAPRLSGPWRSLSHQWLFDLLWPLAGLHAVPYHLVSLASHAACAALLVGLFSRWVSRPAALVGAVFFAAHPALFGALFWISAAGDSLALLFALAALMLAPRADRLRWVSLPAFALSLLAKESTLLLPVVVALAARTAGRVRLTLAAIALVYVVTLAAGNAFGVRDHLPGAAPYALGLGPHIVSNGLTYLGWTAAFLLPAVRGFGDAVDPAVYPWAIGALVLWLAGLASRSLRRRGWWRGGATWLVFLVPVLPLPNHTYHYYLYAPLMGAAWCVAAAADTVLSLRHRGGRKLLGRGRGGAGGSGEVPPRMRTAWILAGAGAMLLTVNGALLVRKIETVPFVLAELRAEPVVDRARIAGNVYQSLASARLPRDVTLLFWSPIAASLGPHGGPLTQPSPRETYWERNVRQALLDGLAVRVMLPQVVDVRFVREFRPAPSTQRYAVYRPDGRVRVATPAEVDSILRSAALER